ncbi:LAME_0A02036g1_1 [Lachancea meyersii CBS 8951]|uniref:LAME_0A02036g1_1 n=1 Tax=Lachancea meyersii CBS 8951 TaxID=1266667 RepID=A0A1G4IMU6_9SACH|nr:LAME_0A02036g1_1 [Lachancea meyersii CBS 8951]
MSSPPVRKALATLLRDPANGNCADCKTATHPRWASWSLGVFICIRCAGFHRSLGTHISKVKSVDLDTWQEQHLRKVVEFGNNAQANACYEAKLENTTPDPSKLGDFIRNKYELRRWEGSPQSATAKTPSGLSVSTTNSTTTTTDASASQELLDIVTSPLGAQSSGGSKAFRSRSGTPSQVDLNLTAPPRTASRSAPRELNGRPDLKKSILSLYSKPRNSSASVTSGQSGPSLYSSANNSSVSTTDSTPAAPLEDNELFQNVWS